MQKQFDTALSVLCDTIGNPLYRLPPEVKAQVHGIHISVGQPIGLWTQKGCLFPDWHGDIFRSVPNQPICPSESSLQESFRILCGDSVYAHQQEIQNGFVTYYGGHRIGICGTAVVAEEHITGIRSITGMYLRVARQSRGIAAPLCRRLGDTIEKGLLLVGRPGTGKTTMLRDLCRHLSSGKDGKLYRVALIDERSEIAGTIHGKPQYDIGYSCNVLDGYPKQEGILQAIRCLSPHIIVCDELGTAKEIGAVLESIRGGVTMIASIHGDSLEDVLHRPQGRALLETGAFHTIAVLDTTPSFGSIRDIYEWNGMD